MASLQELLAKKAAPVEASEPQVKEAVQPTDSIAEETSPPAAVEGSCEKPQAVTASPSQEHHEILIKIRELTSIAGDNLKGEMDQLKKALLENPAAVALMLPEDIGMMVEALRRVTGEAIAEASKPKEKKAKKVVLSADDLQAAFDEL